MKGVGNEEGKELAGRVMNEYNEKQEEKIKRKEGKMKRGI